MALAEGLDFFKLFDLEESFEIDLEDLKTKFYNLSRKYHPDFHSHVDTEKQMEIMQMSSNINKAFKTLKDESKLTEYILRRHGLLTDKEEMPQEFLMEIMDLNEKLFELEMDSSNSQVFQDVESEYNDIQADIDRDFDRLKSDYQESPQKHTLEKIKDVYLKQKYLGRLKEKIINLRSA